MLILTPFSIDGNDSRRFPMRAGTIEVVAPFLIGAR
jgi:hypothetical protein